MRTPCDMDGAVAKPSDLPGRLNQNANALEPVARIFPMNINGYFLSLMESPDSPLARQVLPDPKELEDTHGQIDPLCEEKQSPTPQVIHRYPHRVIFLVSNRCAVTCRFCMRKRTANGRPDIRTTALEHGMAYIRSNQRINEVILSGGDPLMLGDNRLSEIISGLKSMEHVRLLRIHTRVPCAWPQRITAALVRRLAAFRPLYINLHFNHPAEITQLATEACGRLADAGIPLGSQTVLLRDINDDPEVLVKLFTRLLEIRVRPYYLHQLDRVPGTAHFRVPLEKAVNIMDALRGNLSGMAMPHLMVDLPGGGGKVELLPDTMQRLDKGIYRLRNFQGSIYRYVDERAADTYGIDRNDR